MSPDSKREPVAPRLTGRGQNVLRRHFMILRTRLLHSINLIISLFAASSCRYGSNLKLQKWQKADNFKISNVNKYIRVFKKRNLCLDINMGVSMVPNSDFNFKLL